MARKKKLTRAGHRSKFEDTINTHLKRRRVSFTYESERLPYTITRNYVPDFVITTKKGNVWYLETKGYLRPADRAKMVAVKRDNPDADIRILFMKNNKIPRSKMTYGDWAYKYGFPYAFGTKVPREWLHE